MSSFCGCYFWHTRDIPGLGQSNDWAYMPQISLKAHSTILSSTSRTTLKQKFSNTLSHPLEEVSYKFPLYDGVSVVGFKCRVGNRLLHSKVETKEQANQEYNDAIENKQTAALMQMASPEQNDMFVTKIGNVPANEIVEVGITFIGELKQDAQSDGLRYTLPNSIAPRYPDSTRKPSLFSQGTVVPQTPSVWGVVPNSGIDITVDVNMEKSSIIRELQSPSHSVKVSLGCTSESATSGTSSFDLSQASASIRLARENELALETDFVLVVKADGLDNPRAMIETHPIHPDQHAIMATLVPKFNLPLPPSKPEIIFVIDRSGSMRDKIETLTSALQIFLRSLPVGTCFNICSFGTEYSFLWTQSRVYDEASLGQASSYVSGIAADMGGTKMEEAVRASVNSRLPDKDLEVLILTDGQIVNQQSLFKFVRETAQSSNEYSARFFSLGIGNATSHSLIEGIARSGNGISQSVLKYEELDRKVVRMLKGALSPHIHDYKLEVNYETTDQDFELVDGAESAPESTEPTTGLDPEMDDLEKKTAQLSISLFDESFQDAEPKIENTLPAEKKLPDLSPPTTLQAPYKIPTLFPFIRTSVYLILDPKYINKTPKSLTLSATSKSGPLKLTIPISNSEDVVKSETIHQLACRRAMVELEEQHSWLEDSKDSSGNPFSRFHDDTKEALAIRESQILGIKYQVTGQHCSFVALEENSKEDNAEETKEDNKDGETENKNNDKDNESPKIYSNVIQSVHYSHARASITRMSVNSTPLTIPKPTIGINCSATPSNPANTDSTPSRPRPAAYGANISARSSFGSFPAMARVGTSTSSARMMSPAPTQSQPFASFARPPNAQPRPTSSRALFGAAPAKAQSSLFGSTASTSTSNNQPFASGFGANNTTQSSAPLFGAPPARPSGSLFGAAPAQPSGSLFGAPSSESASKPAFGQTSSPAPGPGFGSAKFRPQAPLASFGCASSPSPFSAPSSEPKPTPTPKSKLHSLIALQSFQGNWLLTPELCALVGYEKTPIRQRFIDMLGSSSSSASESTTDSGLNVLATLVAMGFMENQHGEEKSVWELVFDKAENWLVEVLAGMDEDVRDKIQGKKGVIMSGEFFK